MTARPFAHPSRVLAPLLACCAAFAGMPAKAVPVEVLSSWQAAHIDIVVDVDGKPACTLRGDNGGGAERSVMCRFELAPGPHALRAHGEYVLRGDGKGRARKGEQAIALLDFAPAAATLTKNGRPFGERVAAFIEATQAFAREHDVAIHLEAGKPVGAAELDRARQRLGFDLPADFLSMQRTVGAITIGDHSMTSADHLRDAYSAILKDWGTPAEAMQEDYSPKMQELLKSSTLLFTEVGDGLGGLLYRPPPTKACGAGGIYYWTSQEGGDENLSANGACPDFAGAFRWLVEAFVIGELADELADEHGSVLVDTSTGTQALALELADGDAFGVAFARQWQSPH
ncbi:MAG: hypothetical protein ACTHK2_17685 [Dokdonella sp.]|uniref:hypothetical protein n=1 Tax=Dokdonella sp. TaxID=2291710 RepID=UPI003F808AD0